MTELSSVIGDYESFLKKSLEEIHEAGFALSDFVQLDHMCYRVTSLEQYENKKNALMEFGRLLGESMVNGRPIAVFRLFQPVFHGGWRIDTVELPAPKEGSEKEEGLEHIELVLYDDPDDFLKKYPSKEFILKAAARGVNPEIGYKLPSYTVKFHRLNLPMAVYLQNKFGMTEVKDGQ